MLDANAHREGLALEREPSISGKLEYIARRVPARDDDTRGFDHFARARARILQHDRANRATRQLDIGKTREETHLATCGDDALSNVFHDGGQLVGTDMGLRLPKDLIRRARLDERLEDMADMRAFRARGQLAVGKRASATFPELHVRRHVKRTARVEGLDSRRALVDRRTTLDHERAQTRFSQIKRAEKARRPRARDDDATVRRRRMRSKVGNCKRCGRIVCADVHPASGGQRVVGHTLSKADGVGGVEVHIGLLPRINAAFHQGKRDNILRRDPERGGNCGTSEVCLTRDRGLTCRRDRNRVSCPGRKWSRG